LIQLRRPPGQFARVGHRGASALAPENTLAALELAVELGCDMLEFDVLDLVDGTLVLAHSGDLHEVSHGAARGRVRRRDLADLRRVAPGLPTLDEALAFCSDHLPGIGLQLDLKRRGIEAGVADALRRHEVLDRSWVSTFDARSLRRIAELEPQLPRAYTLHYSIASKAAIARAHELDAAVYVWTVDDPRLAEQLVRDGADGIITNDPRIFTMFEA